VVTTGAFLSIRDTSGGEPVITQEE
jgi:hypothetical protein